MFLQEFKVLASASSSKQLRSTLKSQVFELYGEPFTPEFVYEAIRQLPRFASMRVRIAPIARISTFISMLINTSVVTSKMLRNSLASSFSPWMTNALLL